MRIESAIPAFIEFKRYVRGVCPSAAATYQASLRRFADAVGPRQTLDRAAPLVEPFLIEMGKRGLSDWYRAKAFRNIRDLYRWGCDRGHARKNPLSEQRAPIIHAKPKTFLTEGEVLGLLETIRVHNSQHARRDHALVATLYYSWMRVGEVVRSRPGDFDLDDCTVRVFGKGSKELLIPFDPTLAPILRAWLRYRPAASPFMFPSQANHWSATGRLGPDRVQRILRTIHGPAAGLAGRVTPHTLRRSGGTHARARGADLEKIQAVYRHKELTTTMSYLEVSSPDELKGVWRKSA